VISKSITAAKTANNNIKKLEVDIKLKD